jgi:hypothetical protein
LLVNLPAGPFFHFLKSVILNYSSSCSQSGSQLIQFESTEEFDLLSDIMIYSTTSLPVKNGWMTGIFSNPNQIFSTASNEEIW